MVSQERNFPRASFSPINILLRHGESFQGHGWVSFYNHCPRCHRNHRLLGHRSHVNPTHPILLSMESLLGIQATCLVSSNDATFDNSGVCTWLVCRGARAEPDQPTPRNWPSNLCHGHFPGPVGLAYTQDGEQEKATSCAAEASGECLLVENLNFDSFTDIVYRSTAGSVEPWLF